MMDYVDGAASVVVVGYVNLLRQYVPEKWQFKQLNVLLAIACGILYSFQMKAPVPKADIMNTAMAGVVVGLAASGIYSGGKALAGR
jgi:hypothetical protein